MCASSLPRMESDTKEGKSHALDHFRNTPGAVASRDGEFLHPRRIHSHTSRASRGGGFDSRYPRPESGRLSLQARDGMAYRPSSIIVGACRPAAMKKAKPHWTADRRRIFFLYLELSAKTQSPLHWNSPAGRVL